MTRITSKQRWSYVAVLLVYTLKISVIRDHLSNKMNKSIDFKAYSISTFNYAHFDIYIYIVINSETSNKCNKGELESKTRIITNTVRDVYRLWIKCLTMKTITSRTYGHHGRSTCDSFAHSIKFIRCHSQLRQHCNNLSHL